MLLELTMGQAPTESSLADARIAQQHDLGAGVGDGWRGGLAEKDSEVEFVDLENSIGVVGVFFAGPFGSARDENWSGRVERYRRYVTGCQFKNLRNGTPVGTAPQTNRMIAAPSLVTRI